MRQTFLLFGTLVLLSAAGCTVDVTGAICSADGNCASNQHCNFDTQRCIAGERPFAETCATVFALVSQRIEACDSGAAAKWSTVLGSDIICRDLASSVTANRVKYEYGKTLACQTAVAALSCASIVEGDVLGVCPAIKAKVQPGESCSTTYDCAGGWCDTSTGCPGFCRANIASGAACDSSKDRCDPSAICVGGGCRPYVGKGAACDGNTLKCEPAGLFCVPSPTTGNGVCREKRTSGHCSNNEDCLESYRCVDSGSGDSVCALPRLIEDPCTPRQVIGQIFGDCEGFAFCSEASKKCTAYPTELGAACGFYDGKELAACIGSRCDLSEKAGFAGRCVPFLDTGADCSNPGFTNPLGLCGPDGACVNNKCIKTTCL